MRRSPVVLRYSQLRMAKKNDTAKTRMGLPGGRPIRRLLTGQLRGGQSGVLLASTVRKDAEFPGVDDGAKRYCRARGDDYTLCGSTSPYPAEGRTSTDPANGHEPSESGVICSAGVARTGTVVSLT